MRRRREQGLERAGERDMSVIDREKQDQILKSYILELEKMLGKNFKYAEAQNCVYNEKWAEDKIKVIIIIHEKQQDMIFLTKRIAKLTSRYNKRTGIMICPVLQWEDEGCYEEDVIS